MEQRLAAVEDKTGRPGDFEPLSPNRKRSRTEYEEYPRRRSSAPFEQQREMYPQGYARPMQAPMYGPNVYSQNDMPAAARGWSPQAHLVQPATFEVPGDANIQPFKPSWNEDTIDQYVYLHRRRS